MAECLGTTIATTTTIGILRGRLNPSNLMGMKNWLVDFRKRFENCGGKKMKIKNVVSKKMAKLGTGGVESFFERSLARARKLDSGEKLPAEMRITFEDPSDLMRVLSAQRIRVLHTVRVKPRPISGLATILKRDRKAVSRDVKVLASFGLVKI